MRSVLGLVFLAVARAELGCREDPPGSNNGPAVRRYFAGSTVAPPAAWCAAFLRWCLREAALRSGARQPIPGSVGAKRWAVQLAAVGRWYTAEELRADPSRLRPGMVAVWHRGPPGSWQGHVGVVAEAPGTGTFVAIEGNSGAHGDRVAEMPHTLVEAGLLGAGWVD